MAKGGDYAVGRGRTPVETRYKPGQSGNPKGRPKGRKNLKSIVEQTLLQPVTFRDRNGKPKMVSTLEATCRRLRGLALGVHPPDKPMDKFQYAAMMDLIGWARSLGLLDEKDAEKPEVPHSDIIAAYLKRKGVPPEGGGHA